MACSTSESQCSSADQSPLEGVGGEYGLSLSHAAGRLLSQGEEGGGGGRLSVIQSYSGKLQDPDGGIPTQERMVEGAVQRVFTGKVVLISPENQPPLHSTSPQEPMHWNGLQTT